MAHPYKDESKSSSRTKFKAISGRSGSGQAHPDESQEKTVVAGAMRRADDKRKHTDLGSVLNAKKSSPRADRYARGGKVKGRVNVNVNVISPGREPAASPPAAPILPAPIPAPDRPPVGPGPGGGPMMPPMMPPPPMGGPPMGKADGGPVRPMSDILTDEQQRRFLMKKRGGAISGISTKENLDKWSKKASENSYARGGGVKYTGGAESGVGRLEKAKAYGKRASRGS